MKFITDTNGTCYRVDLTQEIVIMPIDRAAAISNIIAAQIPDQNILRPEFRAKSVVTIPWYHLPIFCPQSPLEITQELCK